jgi:hypothetical protein
MLEMKKKESMEILIIFGRDLIRSILIMETMPAFWRISMENFFLEDQ